ncbi:MAG: RsbRD N-terminal domain-containing protein [candidate division Zixibacteria bacterium]
MLKTLLKKKKTAILKRWFSRISKTYPPDGAKFFFQEQNRFANPVGSTINHEIGNIFDNLIGKPDWDEIYQSCENINKIRAVQDFSASEAVAFMFFLKTAILEELTEQKSDEKIFREFLELESDIDRIALTAFDSYSRCREKIYNLKYAQLKSNAGIMAIRNINEQNGNK